MEAHIRILILEASARDYGLVEQELRRTWPHAVCRRVDNERDFLAALGEDFDVVLSDYTLPGFTAMHVLGHLHERGLDTPLIVVSGTMQEETAAECIKQGAANYLLKDRLGRLGPAIARALMERVLRAQERRAEAELRRSKEYYQRLVETVRAIPWELDPADWRFTYLGPQLTELLGYTHNGDCEFSAWMRCIHPDDRQQVRQALSDALLPARDQDLRHRVRAAGGRTVWMRSIITSLGHSSRPRLLRGFTVDITGAVETEQASARRAEELARSNKDLEDFAYVASHDLQEPLRMVSCYTGLLAERYRGRLDADADEFIAYITDGVTRMQSLIRDLLAYSRVSTRGREISAADSGEALSRALTNLRAAISESGASVTHDAMPVVRADPVQLTQVFQNLIGNSIKFRGPAPPVVRVEARESGREWWFSVADNGIGIEPQYAETVFGLFQRLHSVQEYAGTGIGLTICKKIVERHGGRIWLDSELGKGATFHFSLPAAPENGV